MLVKVQAVLLNNLETRPSKNTKIAVPSIAGIIAKSPIVGPK